MTENHGATVGRIIREARDRRDLTSHEVSRLIDTPQSTIVRLEQGHVAAPKPAVLRRLADVLQLNLADLYAAAGYPLPDVLPTFESYLQDKYGDLPAAARSELNESFSHIVDKYGYDIGQSAARWTRA